MSGEKKPQTSELHASDLTTIRKAVCTLSKSLRTILTVCPELVDINPDSIELENDNSVSSIHEPSIMLARQLKKAYNEGNFEFADVVFSATQGSHNDTSFMSDFSLEKMITATNSIDNDELQNKIPNISVQSNDKKTDNLQSLNQRKWPPPLPEITNNRLRSQVFTHKSVANEENHLTNGELLEAHNERLEFLGDAALNYIVGLHVFRQFPDAAEGDLTSIRSLLVCNETLGKWAIMYGLDKRLKTRFELTREEEHGGKASKIIADVFEAYVGGLAFDKEDGMKTVNSWIVALIEPFISEIDHQRRENEPLNKDAKNVLYALIGTADAGPEYFTFKEGDSTSPFSVECKFKGQVLGVGTGANTKTAGIRAAMNALKDKKLMDSLVESKRNGFKFSLSNDKSEKNFSGKRKRQELTKTAEAQSQKKQTGAKDVLYSLIGSAENRPVYKTIAGNSAFETHVFMRSDLIGRGKGRTKKEAENNAAQDTLDNNTELLSKWSKYRTVFNTN